MSYALIDAKASGKVFVSMKYVQLHQKRNNNERPQERPDLLEEAQAKFTSSSLGHGP